jgi:integrase/recombinase XerD
MSDKTISPLRQWPIEDMTIRRLARKTQHDYIRHVRSFVDFVGRSPDKATAEDVHRYQLWLASIGTTVPTVNVSATALRFFFKITLKRSDLAAEVVSAREPRRLPVVLSPEEVGRLLGSTANVKQKAALSLAYATGLWASEVISLKLTDIDSDRMVIRVEQGKSLPPRRRGAKRIAMSCSRPTFSISRANGGAPRARRGGCILISPGCFRLPRATYEHAPAPPARLLGGGTCRHYQARRGSHLAAQLCHPSPGAKDRYPGHSEPAPAEAGVLLGHKKLDTTALDTRVAVSAIGEVTSPLDLLLKIPG